MAQGINADLADITFYDSLTPVLFTNSNVPLNELNANMLILDQKLEGYILSADEALAGAGDGTFIFVVAFASPVNTSPRVAASLADVSVLALGKLVLEITTRTVNGFTVQIIATGTGGAWTANASWIADGR